MNATAKYLNANVPTATEAHAKTGKSCGCGPACKCGPACNCKPGASCTPSCKCGG